MKCITVECKNCSAVVGVLRINQIDDAYRNGIDEIDMRSWEGMGLYGDIICPGCWCVITSESEE